MIWLKEKQRIQSIFDKSHPLNQKFHKEVKSDTLSGVPYFLLDKPIRLLMSSILSWVALSLGGRDEIVGPDGFFARTGSMSL